MSTRAFGSLKGRLLRGLLPSVAFAVVASIVLPLILIYEPTQEAFDAGLNDYVNALSTIVEKAKPDQLSIDPQADLLLRTDSDGKMFYAIIGPDGALRAGDDFLAHPVRPLMAQDPWIYDVTHEGETVRVFSKFTACGDFRCEIRVGETTRKRTDLLTDILVVAVLPVLVLGIALIFVVYSAVRRSIVPIERYTRQIESFAESGWQPIDPSDTFEEIRPMVKALNHAAVSLKAAIDSQQQFLSTAAHQLRTPLMGLKATADLARLTKDPVALDVQLEKLSESADRVARLSTQLLALARAEPHVQHPESLETIDLGVLAQDLVEEYLDIADRKKIDLGFELHPAPLRGHRVLLRELMANLLDNALRYTPEGGSVTLRTGVDFEPGVRAWVEVEDSGPGIAADYREFALHRFARLPGSVGPGSGLGLAIVKEIADAHGAELSLNDAREGETPPGLMVRVDFKQNL